jgi:hypothetical protein
MIGWINDIASAEQYFLTHRLETTAWDALTVVSGGKDEKTAVLNMAYDRLRFCKDFDIPTSPSVAELERLAMAQEETAYYLAMHLADEDRRKGLQAQGVTVAGIVKEDYRGADLSKLPLPPIVYDLLEEMLYVETPFFITELRRNEDKLANESVTDEEDYR